jgi:hypothetical protein
LANRAEQYGFSFTGFINVPSDGQYTFYTSSDDGSNLYIDNVLTVSNDGLHGETERSGAIGLKAGKHAITGLFFQQSGGQIFVVSYEGMGILKQSIPSSALFRTSSSNMAPVANAGTDQTITLPASTVTLTGTGTDSDGTLSGYSWVKISGPSATIASANAAYTQVNNLVQGIYQFELTVTDNNGATGKDTVQVSVNAATTSSLLPAVYPSNPVNGLDYKYYEGNWTLLPNFLTLNPVKTGISSNFDIGLTNRYDQYGFSFTGYINVPADGQYTFYTSSDDGSNLYIDNVLTEANDGLHGATEKSGIIGLKASKHAITGLFFQQSGGQIFVVSYEGMGILKQVIPPASLYRVSANALPVANAGLDQIIALPISSTIITGSGTDSDGVISSYSWNKISGPAAGTIVTGNAASTGLSNLVVGVYQFELTVTDNAGATGKDIVQIIVNAAPASSLLAAVNPNTVNGLDYKYYEGNWNVLPAFTSLTPVKTGTTDNFNISLANRADQYGFSFTGYINVPSDGQYTFYTTSDDGSSLYIDNVLTVINDGLHDVTERSGTIGLKAGKHAIIVMFFEQTGGQVLTVSYEGMGIPKQVIPPGSLYRVNSAPVGRSVLSSSITSTTFDLFENNNGLAVYPNPAEDVANLTISATGINKKMAISVYNSQGTLVRSARIATSKGKTNYALNMSGLENGIYTIIARFDNGQQISYKLLKNL